jgi:diphthine synthase
VGELVLVGMGLCDERDISLRGLEEARSAATVFVELYTSLMEGLSIKALANLTGKSIVLVSRRMLEEEDGREIIEAARRGKTVMLVPGDPLIATTHVDLRMRAAKAGIQTRIVHGASILSAAIGLSGLQNYKFGASVTIPSPEKYAASETPMNIIRRNREFGLHTLCYLDLDVERQQYMTISQALKTLLEAAARRHSQVVSNDGLVVGIARAGASDPAVKADLVKTIVGYDFGNPPHALIFPGRLHFMEAEALIVLANAPESTRTMVE